jgi:hypothetical protein
MKRLSEISGISGRISFRKLSQILCIGFILCTVTSCYYDPDDKYWVDLQSPASAPEIIIDFNIIADTVYFSSSVPVILIITAPNENIEIRSVAFYLDDERVSYTTKDGNYIITPFSLLSGTYKFKIGFMANSGTTSIADKLGAEMYEYKTRELTFIMQSSSEQSKWVKETESESGLTLTWNPGLVFNTYQLRKTISIYSNSGFFLLDTIYTTNDNVFTDTQYVGESAVYQIYGMSDDGKTYILGKHYTSNKMPRMRIIAYENSIAVVWPKTMHANHVKSIELIDKSQPMSPVILATLKNTDTLFALNKSYCGVTPVFTLRFTPEIKTNNTTILCFESYSFSNRIELPGPDPMTTTASTCSEIIYVDNDSLIVYSIEDQKPILAAPLMYGCGVSANGKYALLNSGNSLDFYSLPDYSLIRSIDMTNKFSLYYSVSNTGIGSYNTDNGLEIVDFINNLHFTDTRYSYAAGGFWSEISPDGNYLKLFKDEPYPNPDKMVFAKIEGNTVIPMDSIYGCDCRFYESDPELIYYYKDKTLYVLRIDDLSVIRTLYTGDKYFGNIDFCSNRMITRGEQNFHVYDVLTGNLLYTIPMQNSYYGYIVKNIVYFEYGNKYILPD